MSEWRFKCSEKRHTHDKVVALLIVVNIKRVDAHCAGSQLVSLVMGTDGALNHALVVGSSFVLVVGARSGLNIGCWCVILSLTVYVEF